MGKDDFNLLGNLAACKREDDTGLLGLKADEIRILQAPVGFAKAGHIQGFQKIRFSLSVFSIQNDDRCRKGNALCFIIAIVM